MDNHPLLSFPYVADAPWPDGSDNRFEQGALLVRPCPITVTMDELINAAICIDTTTGKRAELCLIGFPSLQRMNFDD